MQRLVTSTGKKAWGWSDGRPPRQALVLDRDRRHGGAARLDLVAVGPVPARPPDRRRHARGRVPHGQRPGRGRTPGRRGRAAAARAGPPPRGRADPARRPDRGASGALRRQRRRQGRQADDPRQPRGARRPQGADARRPGRQPGGGARRARAGGGDGARSRLVRRAVDDRAGHPAPVHAPGQARRGRLAGARDQHDRRRDRLRRRLLAGHRRRTATPSRTRTPPTRWPAARPARRWRSPSSSSSSSARATRSCRSTSPRRST